MILYLGTQLCKKHNLKFFILFHLHRSKMAQGLNILLYRCAHAALRKGLSLSLEHYTRHWMRWQTPVTYVYSSLTLIQSAKAYLPIYIFE